MRPPQPVVSFDPILSKLSQPLDFDPGAFTQAPAGRHNLQEAALSEEGLPPLLDPDAFQTMKDEAGDTVASAFMEEYLMMLPVRAAKIFKGLASAELAPAVEAITSLKVSSAMAGALRLEAYCSDLERALKHGQTPGQAAVKTELFANMRLVIREASRQGHLRRRPKDSPGS
jgi:histidine phosphotransfer protein HptB